MADEPIELNSDNAILLLAAAAELGLPAEVVRTTSEGFEAPDDVVKKAFGRKGPVATEDSADAPSTDEPKKAPAKRAPAKKAPAKKAAPKSAAK